MIRMNIIRSKSILVYLVCVHALMLVTLLSLLDISWWSLLATVILSVSFIYYAQQYQWLKAKKSIVGIQQLADEQWILHYRDAPQKAGVILSSSFVTPQLIILYFKGQRCWQREAVTIMADAVDAELCRQLRVYLKAPKTFPQ